MAMFAEYTWLLVLGGIAMVCVAFTMGANDVANAFGTSVGSKAISLMSACILASIFETIGSVTLGATVASTMQNDIIDRDTFYNEENVYMMGMVAILLGASCWLLFASMLGLPVSATHSVIGGYIGFGVASGNAASLNLSVLGIIALSWVTSPILTGTFAAALFALLRQVVFRSDKPVEAGFRYLWILVMILSAVFVTFLILGNPISFNTSCYQLIDGTAQWASPCVLKRWVDANRRDAIIICVAATMLVGVSLNIFIYWYSRRQINQHTTHYSAAPNGEVMEMSNSDKDISTSSQSDTELQNETIGVKSGVKLEGPTAVTSYTVNAEQEVVGGMKTEPVGMVAAISRCLKNGTKVFDDNLVHSDLRRKKKDEVVAALYEQGEIFSEKAELLAGSVQVVTACFTSLSHGANDVSNAVGPFAAMYDMYMSGYGGTSTVPQWLLLVCGLSMSLGLACIGYKVIKTLGVRMIMMTPSRGVSIEMASALTVVVFSKLGVPLSSTYCQVGATVGVGMTEKKMSPNDRWWNALGRAFNKKLLVRVFLAWMLTLLCAGCLSAVFFAFGMVATGW